MKHGRLRPDLKKGLINVVSDVTAAFGLNIWWDKPV